MVAAILFEKPLTMRLNMDDLKRFSQIYNELPADKRNLLRFCMMENELRLIKLEQESIMDRANKAIAEHQVRFNNIKRDLDRAYVEIQKDRP